MLLHGVAREKQKQSLQPVPYGLVFYTQERNRPVAMGWHGVANATPGQEDTRILPPLQIFLQLKNMRISITD